VKSFMVVFVGVVNLLSMAGMVITILAHSGRGGGLSDMFGGGGAGLGSTAAEKNLTRITTILAIMWFFTVVSLGLLLD
jgi:preprotein translocase subunit SecG